MFSIPMMKEKAFPGLFHINIPSFLKTVSTFPLLSYRNMSRRKPHKSQATKAKLVHHFRTKILKKKRKGIYEIGYVEALEKRINQLEEKVKALEEEKVQFFFERNEAILNINQKDARIRALKMDQELTRRIGLRKKRN
ncbi:hypothetical protein GLOIN_2v1805339 [Rhizophagus clarus]|uniref:Uncharacterized protein n=1 Tax=Rhizophagus clarus TaxID=94130 RepID=A0A8H3LM15_9GLOM|nr:hypothetical protein GLOIN_2v1805339 [Rhizophagus clarus]